MKKALIDGDFIKQNPDFVASSFSNEPKLFLFALH
jgi:hypothetical protein